MSDDGQVGEKFDVDVQPESGDRPCFRADCENDARYDLSYRRRGEPHRFHQSLCEQCIPAKYRYKITETLE